MSKRILEIDLVHAGQPRRYADAYYEAYITCRDEGTLMDGAIFYLELSKEDVKILTQQWVRNFTKTPEHPFAPTLTVCKAVGPTPEMIQIAHEKWKPKKHSRWHVIVVEPYTD